MHLHLTVTLIVAAWWRIEGTPQAFPVGAITRQNNGDAFTLHGAKCSSETCIGVSSGTADVLTTSSSSSSSSPCTCQCHAHLPAFREDLQICVDDVHECVLSPFVSGATSQQIPFVFLPLKGQIIHPSKEISFAGIQTPLCAVTAAKFLTAKGWIDLRNPIDTDVPFRMFRDEGRTFLQWIGDTTLRTRMGGRLVLVHLMCREIAANLHPTPDPPTIFTPCIAFRVVGTPIKYLHNVSEVIFAPGDVPSRSGLSVSEYIAIGVCSFLLGLIYVASVFLYLHIRRRRRGGSESGKRRQRRNDQGLAEEGVIKNNPLLNLVRHFPSPPNTFSDSNSSDTEVNVDPTQQQHEERKKNIQLTSVLIHPPRSHLPLNTFQESECLPEENVSIVDTLDHREEDHSNSLKLVGTARRKLYFNPAYFEPHLLIAPPPAAIEFLTKIREVITLAKQKMATKRFSPCLMGIPEEDPSYVVEVGSEFAKTVISRRGSSVSLKRENSRRKSCSGCPGCEPQDLQPFSQYAHSGGGCENCSSNNSDSVKQQSIRKWLENVPISKHHHDGSKYPEVRSPTRSLSPDHLITPHLRQIAPRPASEPNIDCETKSASSHRSKQSNSTIRIGKCRPKVPPPLPPSSTSSVNPPKVQNVYDKLIEAAPRRPRKHPPPVPDMVHDAIVARRMKQVSSSSSVSLVNDSKAKTVYEVDSLERNKKSGFHTPPEYVDVSSSQPSPSMSVALPMDEEMTIQNAIINTKTGNMTISKLGQHANPPATDHDYELIVLKKPITTSRVLPGFALPELLRRSNTGYALVSEVYVNNGCNYSSQPSTASDSESSTLERRPKIIYEPSKPGHLLIEVADCADNYIRAEESDGFEPDTLDRKPKPTSPIYQRPVEHGTDFIDSLERPKPILLRSSGTFRKPDSGLTQEELNEAFEKNFSSLRAIYEAKTKNLTLEERHSRRQRKSPTSNPPDVIPPDAEPIYVHPAPPRRVNPLKPSLSTSKESPSKSFNHPENGHGPGSKKNVWKKVIRVKQDDSGYLSTDSNESQHKRKKAVSRAGSETDESLGDGQSESGGESVETHSVFFGSYRNHKSVHSLDSGVGTQGKR